METNDNMTFVDSRLERIFLCTAAAAYYRPVVIVITSTLNRRVSSSPGRVFTRVRKIRAYGLPSCFLDVYPRSRSK